MKKEQKQYPSARSLENLKLVKKPVAWNGQRFESVTEFRKHVQRSEDYVYKAIKHNWKVAGHYWDYAFD